MHFVGIENENTITFIRINIKFTTPPKVLRDVPPPPSPGFGGVPNKLDIYANPSNKLNLCDTST